MLASNSLRETAPVLTLDIGSISALDLAHLFLLPWRANSGFGLSIQPLKYSRSKLSIAAKMSVLGPIHSHFHYLWAAQGRISCEICVASKASFFKSRFFLSILRDNFFCNRNFSPFAGPLKSEGFGRKRYVADVAHIKPI